MNAPIEPELASLIWTVIASGDIPLDRVDRRYLETWLPLPRSSGGSGRKKAVSNRAVVLELADPRGEAEREAQLIESCFRERTGPSRKRFANLGALRLHAGPSARAAARSLGARAFCVGRHVVLGYGSENLRPNEWLALLAHEATHYLQERPARSFLVQCAEVDERAVPAGVTIQDSTTDVNSHVRQVLRRHVVRGASGADVVDGVFRELGQTLFSRPWLARIEEWAENLPQATPTSPGKISRAPQASTKYRGVSYSGWGLVGDKALAPLMKVNGILIGADKLGHFFQLGHDYYEQATPAEATRMGHRQELGRFGLHVTGVYSLADLEANEKGRLFYHALRRSPTTSFDIRTYVNRNWNEYHNPSRYNDEVGKIVWSNLLRGDWEGEFWGEAPTLPVPIRTTLRVIAGNKLAGEYAYGPMGLTGRGNITDGTITFLKDGDRMITGVAIEYQWSQNADSGKGIWRSNGETRLEGTWGNGTSATDGGTWSLERTL